MRKILNKNQIEELKNNQDELFDYFKNQKDNVIIYTLGKLGKLENGNTRNTLLYLMNSKNSKIRSLSVKNLAKLNDIFLLGEFIKYATEDESTEVKRESISAIGRLRNEKTIPILIDFLSNQDPKIVMQAIRGLLVFSEKQLVQDKLKKLISHPNEMIREIINKEFNYTKYKSSYSDRYKCRSLSLENLIVHGDTQQILNYIPAESIQLTFTSPPYYNARDYSIYQSYDEYLNFLENVFKEAHRVTQEGRFLILNTSPIIIPRVSRSHSSKRYPIPYDIHHRLTEMGWEFIDDIIWVKPESSVKNRNAGFLQHRKPLAYKPNAITEYLMVYRKKTDKLIDWNIRQYSNEQIEKSKVKEKYETTNVWHIDPAFDKIHSAVFPLELCNRVIKYYSFVGDLIFDPFAGSGTLGKSALKLKRNFFLNEIKEEYIRRIKEELMIGNSMFEDQIKQIRFLNFQEFVQLSNIADCQKDNSIEDISLKKVNFNL